MHPLAAPGALWVLSRAGKVPRPPAGGRNLSQETDCLWEARERIFLSFLCFAEGFASAEATKGLSDRPLETFGADVRNLPQITDSLWRAGGKSVALSSCFTRDFASAEATRGLSDRPLDPFGASLFVRAETEQINRFLVEGRGKAFLAFSALRRVSPLRRRPGGLSDRPLDPFGAPLSVGAETEQINRFLVEGRGKDLPCFFCFAEGFATAEATRGAFRSIELKKACIAAVDGHACLSLSKKVASCGLF